MAAMMDYLRLCRLPNVFTAVADVLAGYVLVRGSIGADDAGIVLGLCGASALLYSAGMVLNDVFDVEIDRQERPERPLPSGRIPLATARLLGGAMLLGGVLLAVAAPVFGVPGPYVPRATGIVALALAACVLAYDAWLKKTPAGPLAMGACRGLNLLIGMTAIAPPAAEGAWLGLAPAYYVLPAGSMLYITGLTWFARHEAQESKSSSLAMAMLVMLAGVAVIASFPLWGPNLVRIRPLAIWYVLLALLAASIARPFIAATAKPDPRHVQAAVKHGIMSLITIDAAIALCGAHHPIYAVLVVSLVLPARILGQWVYST